jgi:rod shape determining protein RodA
MRWDRRYLLQIDWFVLIALAGLIGAGLVVIASAAHTMPGGEQGFVFRQVIAVVVGVGSWLFFTGFDYRDLAMWSREFYVLTVGLLAAVMVMGRSALGAQRWLKLGPIQFQPSEPAKLLLIICLAAFLANREPLTRWFDLVLPGIFIGVPMLLILKQPDLGTTLVLVSIASLMFYTAGMPGWRLLLGLLGSVGAISFWVYAHVHWHVWIPLKDYQIDRLLVFLNPTLDPMDTGYHVVQSRIAIGSGSLVGKGWYHGSQNQLGFLPEAHTDFIFAVLCEEWGFAGGVTVLALASFLVSRLLRMCGRVEDRFGQLLIAGVAGMLFFQFLENAGMTMGVMPVTGIPLPFVSYGPSAMITNLAAIGMALGVVMRRKGLIFGQG